MKTSKIIDFLVEQGEFVDEEIEQKLNKIVQNKSLDVLQKDLTLFFKTNFPELFFDNFLKDFFSIKNSSILETKNIQPGRISILKSYEKKPNKRTVQDFVRYFNIRFKKIESMLKYRPELSGLTSIDFAKKKKDNEKISIIGAVLNKQETLNKHIILTIEDLSGSMKVLIHKDNKELIELAKDLSLDEIIGISGSAGGDIIFSKTIIHPDVPLTKELKKSPFDHSAVFIGDFHIGSKEFLTKEFHKFLLWINGKLGNLEQRKLAKSVRYLFFLGDVVEGVGIYPGQENDLEILEIKNQYEKAAYYLSKIPSYIKIIIIPGNHDVGRIAEPQLPIDREYAESLYKLPNVIMLSNPSLVSIDVSDTFSGIDVLLYHGYSMIYYSDAVASLRSKGGQKVADEIMVYLLQRRHLAPTHGSTLYIPDIQEDALLIDPIPDIFATGHIHRAQSRNYRNVTCLTGSCWTQITEDQEKRGLEPQPARAMVICLKTREVKMMNFNSGDDPRSVADLQKQKDKSLKKDS